MQLVPLITFIVSLVIILMLRTPGIHVFNNFRRDIAYLMIILILLAADFFIVPFPYSFFLLVLIIAPLMEEFFYRGIWVSVVIRSFEPGQRPMLRYINFSGLIIMQIIFTLAHLNPDLTTQKPPLFFVMAFIMAILFCLTFWIYRGTSLSNYALVFTIIPHGINNALSTLFSFELTLLSAINLLVIICFIALGWYLRRIRPV